MKLFFEKSENMKKMMAFGVDRSKQVLEAAGATKVDIAPHPNGGAYHLMGTARMGTDPHRSVVDRWGCAHDVKNLYVIDGSIFVTGGSAVVTCTLQALALRIADYVKTNHATLTTS